MKKTSKTLSFLALLATLSIGCNQESKKESSDHVVTNFTITGSGQLTIASSNFEKAHSFFIPSALALTPPSLEDSNGLSVILDSAWIVIKKIQFKSSEIATADESEEDSGHYKGPFFIDLLSDSPFPFGYIELPATELRRVKMLLHKSSSLPTNIPQELQGHSIYLSGTVDGRRFTYAADDTTDIQISGPNAIVPEKSKDLLVIIRIAELIKKIDLLNVTDGTNISKSNRMAGSSLCPTIHATARDLYTCFRMGIAKEAKFGKDNGDLDLDAKDETVN